MQRCCVVGLREPLHVNQMARLTDLELDVKEPQLTWAQFPSGETPENPQCGEIALVAR